MQVPDNWWIDFFEGDYSDCVLTLDTKDTFSFIDKIFEHPKNKRIFDQCCGKGHLSNEFGINDYKVTGIDFSKDYIDFANKNYKNKNITFVRDDAKKFELEEKADFGINWHTSFAYSENDEENIKMLKTFSNSLKPKAKFIISTLNPEYVKNNFQRFIVKYVDYQNSTIVNIRESFIEDDMLKSKWLIIYPDGTRKERFGQTKMYSISDFKNIFDEINFEIKNVYGAINFEEYNINASSLIIYGEKK